MLLEKYRNSKLYDGNTCKFGVTIKGVDYIAKFAKTKSDISTLCEHVASSFINNLGYQAHKTILCLYKGEVVVLMKNFTAEGYFLRSFKDTGQSSEDTDVTAKSYTYEDVLYLIDKHTKINSLDKEKVKLHFWRMFVLDAILANRDRHHGNWGYLSKQSGYILAPIYDNGACLFPDVSSRIEEYKKDRAGFLRERAERFPASLLLKYSESEHRNKRTNYNEVIGSMQNRELQVVLKEFRALSFDKIKSAIVAAVSSDLIKPIYKQFFIDIVLVRYLHIVCRLSMEESISRVIEGSLC